MKRWDTTEVGGSTIEEYEWLGGIGPWDQRQPFTTVWGGLEENFVGIDEFVQLCQRVGAEPLVTQQFSDAMSHLCRIAVMHQRLCR